MQAAILKNVDRLEVEEIPAPVCGNNEALMQVKSCAICGSDLRIFHYGNARVKYPAIIGHEIAGIIIETGKNITKVKVGDRIALGADVPCGVCEWCTAGMGTNCKINYAVGYQFPGGFQQKMILNETIINYGPVTLLPDDLSYDAGAIAEPLACAINGLELAQMMVGKSMCVIGLGPIGCMMLELSKAFGASRVFAAQRSRKRLEAAKIFLPEARFIAAEEESLEEVIMAETNGRGVDLVITTAGTVKAHEDAIKIVAHRGYVNLFGGLKNQPKLRLDSNLIHYKECFVMGSHGSLPVHHRKAVDMIARGVVNAEKYISAHFPLAEINAAFDFHESREGMKTIINPEKG